LTVYTNSHGSSRIAFIGSGLVTILQHFHGLDTCYVDNNLHLFYFCNNITYRSNCTFR